MDKKQRDLVYAAVSILRTSGVPFVLATPNDEAPTPRLAINFSVDGSGTVCALYDKVTVCSDAENADELDVHFSSDEQPPVQLPERTAILSGKCYATNDFEWHFDLMLDDNDSLHRIYWAKLVLEYFRKKSLKLGDKLKLRVCFAEGKLMILSADDILEHTREEMTTVNLKE